MAARDRGFSVHFRPEKSQWCVRYKDVQTGKWRVHRIPPGLPRPIVTKQDAERYARAWYDEQKKLAAQGHPKDPLRGITFKEFADEWTSGKLAERYPDHVRQKVSSDDDKGRLAKYVHPIIGHVPLVEFEARRGLELVEQVMASLPMPPKLSRDSRRHVAQVIHRVLVMAVYPAKILAANPLPKGFLPKKSDPKAKAYLYPDEDAKLLACVEVPLVYRLLYGFLAREGLRTGEALDLRLRDLDLERGVIYLDENKTDDPRSWALNVSVAEALRRWKKHYRADASFHDLVFVLPKGGKLDGFDLASDFREHLRLAGVNRPQLFETTPTRRRIRAHDLRATFVTLALANGKIESWVADRTGHKSSQMINTYRRAARTAAELNLGDLAPLTDAIPELLALAPRRAVNGAGAAPS
jgi:integrase